MLLLNPAISYSMQMFFLLLSEIQTGLHKKKKNNIYHIKSAIIKELCQQILINIKLLFSTIIYQLNETTCPMFIMTQDKNVQHRR